MYDVKDDFMFIGNNQYDNMVLDGKKIAECIEYLNKNNISKLVIDKFHYKSDNLEFLENCPHLKELGIDGDYITDYSALYGMQQLEILSISNPNGEMDFSALKTLKAFGGVWNTKMKNLGKCPHLQDLLLWKYKNKDLEEFSGLRNLRTLCIRQSQITSLKGCGGLTKLQKLELSNLRNFEYIDELEHLSNSLTELDFEACSKIVNHEYVACLKSLEWLRFTKCGNIDSLDFIRDMSSLKNFSFMDTNIVNGDLSPCIGLEYVGFNDKKHYSHRFKELNPNSIL